MINRAVHSFFDLNKDRALALLLFCITVAINFVGGVNPFLTAFSVARFELVFITLFVLFYKRISAFGWLTQHRTLFYAAVIWFLLLTASLTQLFFQEVSENQLTSAKFRYLFTVIHLLFGFCIVSYLSHSKYSITQALETAPYCVVIIAFIYYLTLTFGPEISADSFFNRPPFASHIRYIGYICTVGCVISGFWVLTRSLHDRLMPLYAVIALVNLTLLVWLGGRTAIGSVYLTLIICGLYLYITSALKLKNIVLMLLIVVVSIWGSYQASVFPWNGLARVVQDLNVNISGQVDLNKLSTGRFDMWQLSINAVMDSPWLGLGPDGYKFIPERVFGVQPHSMLVQVFVEWGVLGGGLFLLLLCYGTLRGVRLALNKKDPQNSSCALALLVIVGLTLHSLTDGTYYHAQPLYYLVLAFSVLPVVLTKKNTISASLSPP